MVLHGIKIKKIYSNMIIISPVVNKTHQNLRTQVSNKKKLPITFLNWVEMGWFNKNGQDAQNWFLSEVGIIDKPMLK